MLIRTLSSVTMQDIAQVGGKAASLGELLGAGFRVPTGFVVPARAQQLDEALSQQIYAAFDKLKLTQVAVRSSGISEDGRGQSWAGQFATFLHVNRDGLLGAIQNCWESAHSVRAHTYGEPEALAVLVQAMVSGDVSGVAFSVNPITTKHDEVMIEAVYGLCESLVQGAATPDNYVLSKADGRTIQQDIAHKPTMQTYQNGMVTEVGVAVEKQNTPTLSTNQLQAIARLVRRIEQHYGYPVDIEWSYQHNKLYLLQARPITTV